MEPKAEPWDICDYLANLAELLWRWQLWQFPKAEEDDPDLLCVEIFRQLADAQLADTWLEVNVNSAVATRLRNALGEIRRAVTLNNSSLALSPVCYIDALITVLRPRVKQEIQKPAHPQRPIPPEKLSRHYTPRELAKIFNRCWPTVKKLLTTVPHVRHTDKDYQLHIDYLPRDSR